MAAASPRTPSAVSSRRRCSATWGRGKTIRIAVITGAGYSKAGGWPDTTEVLDHPAWLVTRDKAVRYQAVWEAYNAWRGGDPTRTGDVFMAEVLAKRISAVTWPMVVEVVAGTIASVGASATWLASPRYADSLMQASKVPSHRAFFAEVLAAGDISGVVSLNFDLLVEKVLQPTGFHYGGLPQPQICVGRSSSPFPRDRRREPLHLSGAVLVWKPHGSLNWHARWVDWEHRRAQVTIYPDLRAAFRGGGEAAIVPPVMVEDAVPPWLASIWQGAADLLASADEWRVAGYSLPDADVALREMLRDAAAAGSLRRIYIRNKTERTRPRWEAIAGGVPVEFGPPLSH